ncbi:anti-sigma factor family protein [Corynebacterium lubricantis]|uniref:anti-sigma factor family protein n=1 Tax=Corynebacterium lubricantis TaxID=541095 RepID=UPI0012EAB72E|nr:zf-HC2 domain-containing protein [Corynebacterium lubricantis]
MTLKKHIPERRSLRRKLRLELAIVEHLSPEAIAAFVDGELSDGALHRARVHVVHCRECRDEVHTQRHASEAVRGSNLEECVRAPRNLVARLSQIADLAPMHDADNESSADEGKEAQREHSLKALFRKS